MSGSRRFGLGVDGSRRFGSGVDGSRDGSVSGSRDGLGTVGGCFGRVGLRFGRDGCRRGVRRRRGDDPRGGDVLIAAVNVRTKSARSWEDVVPLRRGCVELVWDRDRRT